MNRPAQLRGSRAAGVLQVAEFFINDLLRILSPPGGSPPSLAVGARNHVMLRYGMFHANAELPLAVDTGPRPRLTISLASVVVAWALRAAARQPFLHFHGRHITVDLAAVPGLEAWRDVWPHLKALRITTARGLVQFQFLISIDGETNA